jgi:hypothetical protein
VLEIEPYRWSVRVAAGKARATVYARTQRFEVGMPLSFDAEYAAVTALETVLGAVGADVACGVQRLAALKRLQVDGAEAVVQAELFNPLVHLGVVGEEGSAAMKRISIKLYLDSLEDEGALRRIFDEVVARSALLQTFEKAVELELELRIVM